MKEGTVKELINGMWKTIHTGIVVAETTTHVKVFHPNQEMGDANRDSAQWYPLNSRLITTTLREVKA